MMQIESENDIRSCYCAAAVSFMLRKVLKTTDYGFDREKLGSYVVNTCIGIQGGFTYDTNFESHAGLTYCALATLEMIEWKLS
jgi:geranylgeranyl transferase type-1 subunit beta